MSQRPPRDLDWIPDDSTGINVPSQTKQNAGWLVEKPARQFFNWMWNRLSRWIHYNSGQSQEFIIIDSTNANEKDYDTLAAYIADSPAAGDKVLVKETQALAAQMIIPDGITLRLLDGIDFTRSTNEANSVIKFGSNIIIEGVLRLVLSQTGTTAKAIEFDGDNVVGKINVENSSTGTLTDIYSVNADKTGNVINGFIDNTGGGTITNEIIETLFEDSNHIVIIDSMNDQIVRSRGAFTFQEIRFPINWNFASQVGSDLNIAGNAGASVTTLNSADIAFVDSINLDLRVYRFDGTVFAQVGNELNIAGVFNPSITALSSTDIAFIDDGNDDLRVYRFDGTDWAQVGNDLNIAGISPVATITALSSTDIAFIDGGNKDLRVYRFDGADWAQVGNDLNIAGITARSSIAALSSTDIAFIDDGNEDLRVYRFDGTDWAQIGNDLNIAGVGAVAITSLNSTDIAFMDDVNDDLRIYSFDGMDWAQISNDTNISGTGFAITGLNGNDIAFIDSTNDDLRVYRFGFSFLNPYHP